MPTYFPNCGFELEGRENERKQAQQLNISADSQPEQAQATALEIVKGITLDWLESNIIETDKGKILVEEQSGPNVWGRYI